MITHAHHLALGWALLIAAASVVTFTRREWLLGALRAVRKVLRRRPDVPADATQRHPAGTGPLPDHGELFTLAQTVWMAELKRLLQAGTTPKPRDGGQR